MNQETKTKASKGPKAKSRDDSFEAVAKRLECDMDEKRFREKLGEIARTKPPRRVSK